MLGLLSPDVPGKRIVVVSPHLDDGVVSLGAAMARWSRTGATVELLTVLGCDPTSTAPAGGWDRRGGFATEGESALARREEDRRACGILGATPAWLPYGSVDYERHGADDEIRAAVASCVEGADVVILPGFPLTHPDHEWLARLLSGVVADGRLGAYAEQPYARRSGGEPRPPDWLGVATFRPLPSNLRDRLAKWRAIREYRSQLPLLGMRRSLRRGPHVLGWSSEWVAWTGD